MLLPSKGLSRSQTSPFTCDGCGLHYVIELNLGVITFVMLKFNTVKSRTEDSTIRNELVHVLLYDKVHAFL